MLDLSTLGLGCIFGSERESARVNCNSKIRKGLLGKLLRVAAFLEGDL